MEALPDDGNRYELSYGSLVVTPAPDTRHEAIMAIGVAFVHQRMPPSARVLARAEHRIAGALRTGAPALES